MMRKVCDPEAGLLLMEAIISAVVIAVGLVFISRALGSQLSAVHRVESTDTLLALAHNKLQELEAVHLSSYLSTSPPPPPPQEERAGTFSNPKGAASYDWEISAVGIASEDADPKGKVPITEVRVTVRGKRPGDAFTLSALWPSSWVPEAWYQ